MQLLPDLRPAVLSATYFIQLFSGTFWISVLGGVVGAFLIAFLTWLLKGREPDPFKVNFHIDLWKVLIGMKLVTEEEFAAYNGASTGINRLDPARRMIYEGIDLVCLGSYRGGHKVKIYWTQFHEFSSGFAFEKRLEVVPREGLLSSYPARLFMKYRWGRDYEIGLYLATEWWDKHKDDPEVASFVTEVRREMFTTELVLGKVPGGMIHLYVYLDTLNWHRRFKRAERSLKELGWNKVLDDGPRTTFSRGFIRVTLDAL